MNKWGLIKLKCFCTTKETINKVKTYGMGGNICKLCNSQGLNFQNKQCIQLNIQKIYNTIKKRAENLNWHFSKEDIWITNRHVKKRLTLLIIRERQIKTMIRYHLTLVRMAIIKKSIKSSEKGVEKWEPSHTHWWECEMV